MKGWWEKYSPNRLAIRFFVVTLHPTKPVPCGRAASRHRWNSFWPTMPLVGQAEEKAFNGRYRSVTSNFATLNPNTEVMQRKRLRGSIMFPTLMLYIIMYSHLWYI